MENAALCRPVPVYTIEESVWTSPLGLGLGKVSASLVKLSRKIAQMCIPQEYVVDGKSRNGTPSTLEYVKHYLGLCKIDGRDKPGEAALPTLVYAGFQNLAETGLSFGRLRVKGTTRVNIPTPRLFIYGHDPIPHVKLYSNQNILFYTPGGQGPPTAVAIYDPGNKGNPIQQVPPGEQKGLIEALNARAANYRWR